MRARVAAQAPGAPKTMFPRGALIDNYCRPMPDPDAHHGSLFRKKRPFLGVKAPLSTESGTGEDQFQDNSFRPSTSSKGRRRNSSLSSLTELRSTLRRRSASLRSRTPSSPSVDNLAISQTPDKRSVSTTSLRPSLTTFPHHQKSSESINRFDAKASRPLATTFGGGRGLALHYGLRSDESHKHQEPAQNNNGGDGHGHSITSGYVSGSQNPAAVFQHLQDTASKRISTIDYLRKAYVPVDTARSGSAE